MPRISLQTWGILFCGWYSRLEELYLEIGLYQVLELLPGAVCGDQQFKNVQNMAFDPVAEQESLVPREPLECGSRPLEGIIGQGYGIGCFLFGHITAFSRGTACSAGRIRC